MPLCVIDRRDRECPVIICDYCGEEIKTAADGNYQYRFQVGEERAAIFFTHKKCGHAFDETHPSGGGGAMELDFLLVCLENTLKFDRKRAEARAAFLGSIEL
jgi:hypothetical protein